MSIHDISTYTDATAAFEAYRDRDNFDIGLPEDHWSIELSRIVGQSTVPAQGVDEGDFDELLAAFEIAVRKAAFVAGFLAAKRQRP